MGFRHELVGVSGGQCEHGHAVMLYAVGDLVCPLQAAIVIAGVQSGCQYCDYQPSPCLCFHGLNPFWQIDGEQFRRLAENTQGKEKKFAELWSFDDFAARDEVVEGSVTPVEYES